MINQYFFKRKKIISVLNVITSSYYLIIYLQQVINYSTWVQSYIKVLQLKRRMKSYIKHGGMAKNWFCRKLYLKMCNCKNFFLFQHFLFQAMLIYIKYKAIWGGYVFVCLQINFRAFKSDSKVITVSLCISGNIESGKGIYIYIFVLILKEKKSFNYQVIRSL